MQHLPLLPVAGGWVLGLAAARWEGVSWSAMLSLTVLALLVVLFGLFARRRRTPLILFAGLTLGGLIWGWAGMLADARSVAVDPDWLQQHINIRAEVAAIQRQGRAWRLTLTDVQREDGAHLHGKAWLYVHDAAAAGLLTGDRIRAEAHFHLPRNRRNPSGFDFAAWCFDRHIALLGSASGEVLRTAQGASGLERFRDRIRQALRTLPAAQGGVIRALLLGERQEIPEPVYDTFAATGAAHLLAISGLHVGLVAALGFALCWFVLTRREAWIVRLPVRGLALLGGVLLAMLYAQLAAWPLPTERATMMLAAAALAWWLQARTSPLNTLLAALLLILLLAPSAITSLSLWLSFIATAAILLYSTRREGEEASTWRARLVGLLAVTLLAWLGTMPLVAQLFGRLSLYAVPANLLATPLYTLLVLPLCLAAALFTALGLGWLAHALFLAAGTGVEVGNHLLQAIQGWPGGQHWIPLLPLWLSLSYVAGLGLAVWLLLHKRRWSGGAVGLLVVAGFCLMAGTERPPKVTQLIAWDVGQGAASSLLMPGGRVMVVDAAGRPGSRFNAGTTMVAGLRGMGLTHVDVLMISHAQYDHYGGALSLVQHLNRIGELWLADVPDVEGAAGIATLRRAVLARGGRVRMLGRGDRVEFFAARGQVLWPPHGYAPGNANNASLVLQLQLPGGKRLLFDGDIESTAESRLLAASRRRLASDVMLIPHHGSRTSSTPGFVAAVHPSIAIAQTGFANRYGFPAARVVRRYSALGCTVFATAHGAVALKLDAHGPPRRIDVPPVASDKRNRALQWWRDLS